MGPRAGIGDPRAGVAGARDHDDSRLARFAERVLQMVGGDAPRVRRQIDERVDQRPSVALPHEIADQAVGIHPVGGAEIDHAEHRLVRKQSRRGQHGRVGRLERSALRERVPGVVVGHARELGAI